MTYLETLKRNNKIRENVIDLLKRFGYQMVETSYFETYDGFMKCSGRTPKEKTVKVINNKGDIEILRPDITFNIIKELSSKYDDEPMKLYYDSTVFKNGKDGILEKRQIGAENVGILSIDADVEMIKLGLKVIEPLDDVMMVIGHTKYLDGLLKQIFDTNIKKQIKDIIYMKQPQLLRELLLTVELEEGIKEKLTYLVSVKEYEPEELSKGYMNSDMKMALSEMNYIRSSLDGKVSFDLSLLSKFEYYDGVIFKGYYRKLNKPLVRGGRYDRLSRLFDKEIPAVGFSIEFDELLRSMTC